MNKDSEVKHEHTPGPWVAKLEDGRRFAIGTPSNSQYSAFGYCIARTIGRSERDRANASLIAAAPEMLAALRNAADGYETIIGILNRTMPGWSNNYTFGETLDELRAIIAKAEGCDQ